MPWRTHYAARSAEIRYYGETTGEQVLEAKKEFFAHRFEKAPIYVICDFSSVDKLAVTPADIRRIVQQDREVAASTHENLIEAVVAPSMLAYGMSRMWELLVSDVRSQTTVRKTRAEVMAWLAEQEVTLAPEHHRELVLTRGEA